MRHFSAIAATMTVALASFQVHALPACDPSVTATLRQPDVNERTAHRSSTPYSQKLIYDFDSHSGEWFFTVRYVIGEDGRVTCISPGSAYDEATPEITPQRQAALDALAAQQFTHFLTDGKPAEVYAEALFYEEEKPGPYVPRPVGELDTAEIRLNWMSRGEPTPFSMLIQGDGRVTYTPGDPKNILGPQTYRISPERVRAMLDLAEAAQFWSLRDVYHFDMNGHGWFSEKVEIHLGTSSKSFSNDGSGGAPSITARLTLNMAEMADVSLWWKIDHRTLEAVAKNGFDFTSDKGAELLSELISNSETTDDVISDLLSRGAPQDRLVKGYPFDFSLLDAAIAGRRFDMANRLIDQGALTVDGQVDRAAVTRALAHAVKSGSPGLVKRVLALGPDLVIRRNDATRKIDPIITFAYRPDDASTADFIAIIQLLLYYGADINSRDTFRHSVLDKAIARRDIDVIHWLLNHDAEIETNDGLSPLREIYEEDTTLILLEAGADLSKKEVLDDLIRNARVWRWLRVTAWLRAHGKWPD
ncbi:hypothetical protein ABI_17420 [Asticcacaulis biprosthecium C19]|uniref:Uncharacterized protein n=1 Tax=Asticcacaulis biprosthecium C19 TaxID=715226 RepID=F4QKC4_9CAUL|nr:ankyrin repeat domain-containing protein [Asticcacaulis biprosthecium]EGF93302.1 hypothetical protein ABI_17420 [Asticcacaulis biprosthecium C19]